MEETQNLQEMPPRLREESGFIGGRIFTTYLVEERAVGRTVNASTESWAPPPKFGFTKF